MPSLATFSRPLAVGQGKDKRAFPPTSMKAPVLPEPLRIDTSDILVSVQSVPSPSEDQNYNSIDGQHNNYDRPSWHTNHPYHTSDSGFSGGHQYKVERMEEKQRLRSLGLLSGTPTPQSEKSPTVIMASSKPDNRRRSSWQTPIKGKLQKQRNKSKDPESRKSMDARDTAFMVNTDYQSQFGSAPNPQYSFSRVVNPSAHSPQATPTRDLRNPRPPFSQAERSNSSLGTFIGMASTTPSTSLGNLVDFYGTNSPGQAYNSVNSSPSYMQQNYSNVSSQNSSPSAYQRPNYYTNGEHSTPPQTQPGRNYHTNYSQASINNYSQEYISSYHAPPHSVANSSTASINQVNGTKHAEQSYKPYEPRYAAKSHVTSTVPLSQTVSQEAVPFVHLDFSTPQKPFAPRPMGQHKSSSETRLTTQEAKEFNAIAQATRDSHVRFNSPSETSLSSKRPQMTPSRLSHEVRSASTPEPLAAATPLKSILRRPVEPTAEEKKSDSSLRKATTSGPNSARTTPEPARTLSNLQASETVSPITAPVELEAPVERGRSMFKRGEESGSPADMSRRPSVSARKSIDIENPSAKNFDISKYAQEKFQKPAEKRSSRNYPPVSYKPPSKDHSPSNSSENIVPIPPVPALPEFANSARGLSTPPPIRHDSAIESSSDEESTTTGSRKASEPKAKSKLSSSVTTIESAPVRPRAPSMSEILKDFHKIEPEDVPPTESDGSDWLSQLFRGKKTDFKLPSRPPSRPGSSSSSGSPSLSSGKFGKRGSHSRNSSRDLTAQEQQIHERAERQRLEVERKLLEAESEPSLTPRSPRFPRPNVSVTASPDLRAAGNEASSLRTSSSTSSVDRLDPVVGGSSNLGKAEEIPDNATVPAKEKKNDRSRRLSQAEVREQLGEMTPPHEREDWEEIPSTKPSPPIAPSPADPVSVPISPVPVVAPLNIPAKLPIQGRLPLSGAAHSPATSTSSKTRDSLLLDARSSSSSLLSLEAYKTMTKVLVVCCKCSRLHDPPNDLYRQMTQGSSKFKCPYCVHAIDVLDCCSAYTSICNMIEKLH